MTTGQITLGVSRQTNLNRPYTAPSSGQAVKQKSIAFPSGPYVQVQQLPMCQNLEAPPRPPRPDADVLLDVDAWLATSKPSSPLMGGLSYWREGDPADTEEVANVQYAIPIIQDPDCVRFATSHSQQLKSLCRRAKRQVRMPSIRRVKSPWAGDYGSVRPESAPVLGIPYEQTHTGEAPTFFTRMSARTNGRPSTAAASLPTGSCDHRLLVPNTEMPLRELCCEMERLGGSTEGLLDGSTLRPGDGAVAYLLREDSMGSFSSAPTYFSGMPPPSYKSRPASSRPASILTTSSFGCIDGMNPEQRQLSQKRVAKKQRSMKGRLRKLAQKANMRK